VIRDLLNYLELQVKQEGSQLVIDCPQCGKEKHCHVAPETGLWHCKVCSASGNPWRLVEIMMPNLDTKGIYQMLKEHGLHNDNQNSTPPKQPNLKLTKNDIRPMSSAETATVACAFYSVQNLCDLMGCTRQTLYQLDISGRIPQSINLIRHKQWLRSDFDAWLLARTTDGRMLTRKQWQSQRGVGK
jgi:predicted DNA-binding transcriptional regulator AlpA